MLRFNRLFVVGIWMAASAAGAIFLFAPPVGADPASGTARPALPLPDYISPHAEKFWDIDGNPRAAPLTDNTMRQLFKVEELGGISTCRGLLGRGTRDKVYSDNGEYRQHRALYDSLTQACASSVALRCGSVWGAGTLTKVRDQNNHERCMISTVAHLLFDRNRDGELNFNSARVCDVYRNTDHHISARSAFGAVASIGDEIPFHAISGARGSHRMIENKSTPGDYRDEAIFEVSCRDLPDLPAYTIEELKRENTSGRQCAEVQTPALFGIKYISLNRPVSRTGSVNVIGRAIPAESLTHRFIDSLNAEFMSGGLTGELCNGVYVPKTMLRSNIDHTEAKECHVVGTGKGTKEDVVICDPRHLSQVGISIGHALELFLNSGN